MKKALFLGCNNLQLGYLKAAQALGFHVIATDQNPQAPGRDIANEFHVAGYLDQTKLLAACKKSDIEPGHRIFTASAHFAYEGAAVLSEKLGLIFPSSGIIDTCLDKSKFYEALKDAEIPLPETHIYHEGISLDPGHRYYLKSDYGKTPNYNYLIQDVNPSLPALPANDQYYRHCFLLQKEICGQHYRVNLYGSQMAVFVSANEHSFQPLAQHPRFQEEIKEKLQKLVKKLGLNSWLIKFDVLMDSAGWYVIDLGLDPPMRLRQFCQWSGLDFCSAYVKMYLLDEPESLPPWDKIYQPVTITGNSTIGFTFSPQAPPGRVNS